MKAQLILVVLLACQALAESEVDLSLSDLKDDFLKKISSPDDTPMIADAKDVIAEYLISTVLDENQIVPFGRGKDRDRHRNRPRHTHRPHIDYRDPPPTNPPVVNVVRTDPPVNAAVNPAVPQGDTQTKVDPTQVPVITGAPAGGSASGAPAVNPAPQTAAPVTAGQTAATVQLTTTTPRPTRPTVDPNHVYQQVDKILGNVATGNIVGIVDESLAIRAPTPVRNFVTGILKVIFCNPVDRIFGRCRPNSSGAISSVQGR